MSEKNKLIKKNNKTVKFDEREGQQTSVTRSSNGRLQRQNLTLNSNFSSQDELKTKSRKRGRQRKEQASI